MPEQVTWGDVEKYFVTPQNIEAVTIDSGKLVGMTYYQAGDVTARKITCDSIEVKSKTDPTIKVIRMLEPGECLMIPLITGECYFVGAKQVEQTQVNYHIDYSFALVLVLGYFITKFLNWVYQTYKRGEAISNFPPLNINIPMPKPNLPPPPTKPHGRSTLKWSEK